MTALGIFGEDIPESVDDSLPANPAEWLASLGAQTTEAATSSDSSESSDS